MKTKKFILSLTAAALSAASVMAMDMKVGDVATFDIGTVPHVYKCEWSASRPDALSIATTPNGIASTATVKVVKSLNGSPCTLECTYYYSQELDPKTGEHKFTRTGKKSWELNLIEE